MNRKERKDNLNSDEGLISKHVETLTNSGLQELNRDILAKIKRLCKKTATNIDIAYKKIMCELKKPHAEIRNSAFKILKELFSKSHEFRKHVISDLELICELTIGINPELKLPPPKDVAQNLKKMSLVTLLQWKVTYGDAYKQLGVCCQYLTHSKGINFNEIQREEDEKRQKEELKARQLQQAREEKIEELRDEFNGVVPDVESAIEVAMNCVGLLLPTPEDFFVPAEADDEIEHLNTFSNLSSTSEQFEPRQFGLSHTYSLTITLDSAKRVFIKRTEQNSSIIDNMRDAMKILNKYLPTVKKWVDLCSSNSDDKILHEQVNAVWKKIDKCRTKFKEINIEGLTLEESESEDDQDFIEVKKDGFEDSVGVSLLYEPSTSKNVRTIFNEKEKLQSSTRNSKDINIMLDKQDSCSLRKERVSNASTAGCSSVTEDVESYGPTEKTFNQTFTENKAAKSSPTPSTSSSRKKRLLAVAPKLPYDIDLYHWEDETLTPPTIVSSAFDTPTIWGSGNIDNLDEVPDPRGAAALRTRTIEFAGEFEPVKWSCRVPLLSGKLCPRRDRVKCPFHGKIVPRDKQGKCVELDGEVPTRIRSAKEPPEEEEAAVPDWQDPQLLAELKAATGIDLKMPEKRKKKTKVKKDRGETRKKRKKGDPSSEVLDTIKEMKFPGIREVGRSNTQARLKKKIFNRSSMKRIGEDIRRQRQRRYNDKFGDQFNYT